VVASVNVRVVALVLALLCWALPTHAAEPIGDADSTFDDEPAPVPERWYGWQTLVPDATAMSLAALTLATEEDTALWELGIGTFALGGPIVHAIHDRPLLALGDFALRVGVPFAGLFIGAQIDAMQPMECFEDGPLDNTCEMSQTAGITGGVLGAVLVATLDATVFSYEPIKPERRPPVIKARVQPTFAITSDGARAGVVGIF